MTAEERLPRLIEDLEEARERIRQLEEALAQPLPDTNLHGFSRQEKRFIELLLTRKVATSTAAGLVLGNQQAKSCDVVICRLRKKLRPLGIEIKTIWGEGWFIPDDHKAIIRAGISCRPNLEHAA